MSTAVITAIVVASVVAYVFIGIVVGSVVYAIDKRDARYVGPDPDFAMLLGVFWVIAVLGWVLYWVTVFPCIKFSRWVTRFCLAKVLSPSKRVEAGQRKDVV